MERKLKRPSQDVIRTALRQLIESNGWQVLQRFGSQTIYKVR